MCGLTGFLAARPLDADATARLRAMADAITHRGPDNDGYWCDQQNGIGLAHRRLAIVELSDAGRQPMVSPAGRYVLSFNGEIYNHDALRSEMQQSGLAPSAWRGHSDTETLLAGFDAWGIEATLRRAIGMFAIALWDRAERRLTLARDRLGEKPLYYGWQGCGANAVLLFGSELAALRKHPAFSGEIDRDALALYMRHNAIGGAHSIYRGIAKLLPGTIATLAADGRPAAIQAYWSATEVAEQGLATPFRGGPQDAVQALDELLRSAVRQQMMADVPLGAFLSGGIDSSTIVALMQAQSSRPVKTFTIGFHETGYDEAQHAKAVAQHLGTDHTELYVTPAQAMEVIPRLPTLYSEPFADSSQIPTFLVSELARKQVTVSLSGDAGDELFCGYNRYLMTSRLWQRLDRTPQRLRRLGARAITGISPHHWNRAGHLLRQPRMGDKLHKGADVMTSRSAGELYYRMASHWTEPGGVVIGGHELQTPLAGAEPRLQGLGDVERMMALDTLTYLPDDILVKVDRAAMGVSLETRVPLLDHRVVEFAWRLPLDYKLRGNVTKWILREVLYRYVPRSLIERPKMGFGVPIGHWLRGPLRPWAEELLAERRLHSEGYLHPAPIRRKWAEHLSGQRDWQYHLWDVLMFQAWLGQSSRNR